MKKIYLLLIIGMTLLTLTGCEEQKDKIISNGKRIDTRQMKRKDCTRIGTLKDGEANMNYTVYYTGDRINIIEAEETVTSSKEEVLTVYENAYKNINESYKNLEYYDTKVIRTDTTVSRTATNNYDKININALIDIEGEEDNIFTDKVPLLSKWLELGKKIGIKCKSEE